MTVDVPWPSWEQGRHDTKTGVQLNCDDSACTSLGNDCCAPGTQARTCRAGLSPVDLKASCNGHWNALYTCCAPSPSPPPPQPPQAPLPPTPAQCDATKCTSVGNDCCAPGDQARTCSHGFFPVGLDGRCNGHENALYTCCPQDTCADAACTSSGNDCCAPSGQERTCSGGLLPVDLDADCAGAWRGVYTCCAAGGAEPPAAVRYESLSEAALALSDAPSCKPDEAVRSVAYAFLTRSALALWPLWDRYFAECAGQAVPVFHSQNDSQHGPLTAQSAHLGGVVLAPNETVHGNPRFSFDMVRIMLRLMRGAGELRAPLARRAVPSHDLPQSPSDYLQHCLEHRLAVRARAPQRHARRICTCISFLAMPTFWRPHNLSRARSLSSAPYLACPQPLAIFAPAILSRAPPPCSRIRAPCCGRARSALAFDTRWRPQLARARRMAARRGGWSS